MQKPINNNFKTHDLILISIIHHLHDIYTSFLAPLLPLLIEKLAINYTMVSFLSVAQRIPSLLNPIIGIMADKFKVRYFIVIAPAITALSMSLIGVAPGYPFLLVILFISGISSTLFHVPTPVLVKKLSGNKIGKGMSYFMLGGELARTIGPLVILGVVSIWKLEGSYRLFPLGIVASIILYLKLRKIELRKDFESAKIDIKLWDTFKSFMPVFITMAGITFFRGAMKSALTLFLPIFIKDQGNSLWFAGISLSVLQLAGAFGTFIAGPISDKIGRKNTLLISAIITPLMMFIFINTQGLLVLIVLIFCGIFLFFPGPVMLAAVHDFDTKRGSFVNGIYFGMNFILNSITVFLVGYFSDKFGLENVYRFSIIWALLTIPFILRFKENNKEMKTISKN